MEARDFKALGSFQLGSSNEYTRVLTASMVASYEWSKKQAADMIHAASPATSRPARLFINQNAQAVADKQFADLLFGIKAIVLGDLRRNDLSEVDLSLADILSAISAFFGEFYDEKLTVTGPIILAQALNRAREDVFSTNRNDIWGYQYSALLDPKVCKICRSLDGSTVDYAGWRSSKWKPPIHFHCRCIWIAILNEQLQKPALRPIPATPGGTTEPLL